MSDWPFWVMFGNWLIMFASFIISQMTIHEQRKTINSLGG